MAFIHKSSFQGSYQRFNVDRMSIFDLTFYILRSAKQGRQCGETAGAGRGSFAVRICTVSDGRALELLEVRLMRKPGFEIWSMH